MNKLDVINDTVHRIKTIFKDDSYTLSFSIGDIARIAKLSQNKIRYWTQRGYIKSTHSRKNTNHRYSYSALIKIEVIKSYLDSGYTLSSAVKRTSIGQRYWHLVHTIIADRLVGIRTIHHHPALDFGAIRSGSRQHILFIKKGHRVTAKVTAPKTNQH